MSIPDDHMKFYAHIYYKVYVCIATLNQDTIFYLGTRPHMFGRSSHGQFRTSTFGKNIFNVLKVFDTLYNKARAEGAAFEKSYLEDVQFVVSRTNHHFHKLNRKGERVPLSACLPKTKKKVLKCKHDFPREPEIIGVATVICKGNAKKHRLRIRGRRNALGMILRPRNDQWFSGTARILAAVFRSNTNTMFQLVIREA